MGSVHADYLYKNEIKNAKLTALCDINPDKLKTAREKYPDIAFYGNYTDLLESGKIDAVIIATPHYLHPVIAKEAFARGINVLSEKPIGVYTKAVEEMNEAAEKSGKAFGIMYNQRTNPYFQKMREIIKSGELGQLKRCVWIITDWYRTQAYYNSGGWRATWNGEGGGVLINQCPHNLDLWQWLFGMPTRVRGFCAYGKYHDIEVEDDVTAYAEYANGATAVFITTTGETPGTNRLEISGDGGKLVYEGGKLRFWKLHEREREFTYSATSGFAKIKRDILEFDDLGKTPEHRGITQNFTNHLISGEELLAPGKEGINGLTISNAIHLSDWTNDWVNLPIDADLYLELLNKKRAASKQKTNVNETVSNLEGTY